MSFDRAKAQLREEQIDVGEHVDSIYELARENLDDGADMSDLMAIPELAGDVMKLVMLIRRQPNKVRLGNVVAGGVMAAFNDNVDDLDGE